MLSLHVKFVQTDRRTEGRTTVKQYAPDLSIWGHKTCGKTTSIFFFSHDVFYPIKDRNNCFSNIKFVVSKCFQFGQGQNFVIW